MPNRMDMFNVLAGTIPLGGSVSQTIDTEGYQVVGLIVSPTSGTLTAGTVQFRVSPDDVTFVPLMDGSNVRVGIPFSTTAVAYSATALSVVSPYRYWRVETTNAQGNGINLRVPVKLQ